MVKDLISVIVPVYNAEKYLMRCIDSILSQTEKNFELILVDDGSVDHSRSICEQAAAKDRRIRVIHKKNGGVSTARNTGLDHAEGEYIAFIDSDDYVESNYLEILKKHLRPEYDLVFCGRFDEDVNGKILSSSKPGKNRQRVVILKIDENYQYDDAYSHWACWGSLYRREKIGTIRFHAEYFVGEDVLFVASVLQRCRMVVVLSDHLYHYVNYPESAFHGRLDKKKLTDLDAWQEIVALHQRDSAARKSAVRCYAVRLCSLYQRAAKEQNIQIQKILRRRIHISYRNLQKSFSVKGFQFKAALFCIERCPYVWDIIDFLYQKIRRRENE